MKAFWATVSAVALGVVVGGAALLMGPSIYRAAKETAEFNRSPKARVGYGHAVCSSRYSAEMLQKYNTENSDGRTVAERIEAFTCERSPDLEVQKTSESKGVIEGRVQMKSGGFSTLYFVKLF